MAAASARTTRGPPGLVMTFAAMASILLLGIMFQAKHGADAVLITSIG